MQLSLATHLPPCLSGKTNSIDWPQVPLTDCYKWHSRSKNQINIVFFSLQIQLEKATQGVILHVLVMATIRAETLNKHQSCHQHQASSQWGPLTGLKLIAHRAASEAEGSFSSGIITAPPVLASMTANCTSQCTHTHTLLPQASLMQAWHDCSLLYSWLIAHFFHRFPVDVNKLYGPLLCQAHWSSLYLHLCPSYWKTAFTTEGWGNCTAHCLTLLGPFWNSSRHQCL